MLLLLLLLAVLQARLWIADDGYRAAWRLSDQVASQARENAMLVERNRALKAEVADLKTGLDAVEEIARSELGMIREGETLYQVVEPDTSAERD
nr:cell division protein FtsB [Wenzhouxiangella sp. XN24]